MMFINLVRPLAVIVTGISLALAGCGEELGNDSGEMGVPEGTRLTYNIFNRHYDNPPTISNITREQMTFANTGMTMSIRGLLKPYAEKPNQDYDYEIGERYLQKHAENNLGYVKNMQVSKVGSDRYKVSYESLGENNQKTNHVLVFKEIDISGYYDFAKKEQQGFYTWVNNTRFNKLPAAVTFPTGSTCFAMEQAAQDRITYGFRQSAVTNYTSLNDYLAAQYGVITSSIRKINVGLNNESQVVEYRTTNSDSLHYAVLYQGRVYDDAYKNDLLEVDNTDITKGEVSCEPLNETAAHYMEQQLIKAYR